MNPFDVFFAIIQFAAAGILLLRIELPPTLAIILVFGLILSAFVDLMEGY